MDGTLIGDHLFRSDGSMEEDDESSLDYMVCDSTSKLIPKGFMRPNCTGNIRVFCRCRPLSKREGSTVVDFDSASNGELGVVNTKKTFRFDRVFTPNDNQDDVFAHASPLVTSVLDGYNVCLFAYGQSGTGKTFTMEGTEGNRGVNYRTVEELFKIAKERIDTFTYDISVSVLEVYNEQIRDLLATPSSSSKKLEIKQASEGLHNIPGLIEAKVENIKEVWSILQAGSSARVVGSNKVNEHSSRSHCMLSIMVKAKNLITGDCTKSKLWLVDLAGSERLAKTDAQGERLKEAQNINRSLSALGDVISALANKSSHIPYRNSKLTHLLQDSLGGHSKTLMFVQISPSEHDMSETLSSLNFATRVRGVELGPARKQIDTSEFHKPKTMVRDLESQFAKERKTNSLKPPLRLSTVSEKSLGPSTKPRVITNIATAAPVAPLHSDSAAPPRMARRGNPIRRATIAPLQSESVAGAGASGGNWVVGRRTSRLWDPQSVLRALKGAPRMARRGNHIRRRATIAHLHSESVAAGGNGTEAVEAAPPRRFMGTLRTSVAQRMARHGNPIRRATIAAPRRFMGTIPLSSPKRTGTKAARKSFV